MEKKQVLFIVKALAIVVASVGIVMIFKQNLVAAVMIISGTVAFYFAERS